MGKTSKQQTVSYPRYSGGTVNINGETVATTKRKGNKIISNYNMSNTEKSIYDSVNKNLESSLKNLFEISAPQRKAWNEQLDALKAQGIENIDSIYTPMQNNLKNDIAQRFGNLDNSSFMNNLKSITNSKNKAIAELSNNLALAQNDLYTNEIQNRINTANFLYSLNNSYNNNILSYLGLANNNSSSGNSYNQSYYNTNSTNSGSNNYLKQLASLALQKISYI